MLFKAKLSLLCNILLWWKKQFIIHILQKHHLFGLISPEKNVIGRSNLVHSYFFLCWNQKKSLFMPLSFSINIYLIYHDICSASFRLYAYHLYNRYLYCSFVWFLGYNYSVLGLAYLFHITYQLRVHIHKFCYIYIYFKDT